MDGRILLLGCNHDTVTFLHYAEHVADIPDKIVVRFKVPMTENGHRVWRDMEEFDTSAGAHANWPDRFFARLVDTYCATTGNRGGVVGDSSSVLLDARGLLEFALPVMKAVAAEATAADALVRLALVGCTTAFRTKHKGLSIRPSFSRRISRKKEMP